MTSPDYPEYVAQNVAIWTKNNAEYTGPRARDAWAQDEHHVGRLRRPRVGGRTRSETSSASTSSSSAAVPRTSRRGSRSAARGRSASIPTPAQLATARDMQAEFGARVPARRGGRRGRAAAGRVVRPRRLRVRRLDLGRSVPMDPRGGAAPATRREARLPAQLDGRRCSAMRPRRRRREPPAAPARSEPDRVARHRRGRVPPPGRRADRRAAREAASRSSVSSSSTRRKARRRTGFYDYVTADWARKWPAEEIWVARKHS